MDRTEARTEIYTFVTAAWAEVSATVVGTAGHMRYQGVRPQGADPLVPPNDMYWARVSLQIISEDQETLRLPPRRFVTVGHVFVQLFCPIVDINVQPNLDVIAEQLRNKFRTYQTDKIEFTRSRVADNIPAEPNWLRANVVSEFAYRQFM
jgi:hypothetical protein